VETQGGFAYQEMTSKEAKDRAEAAFNKKELQAREGSKAAAEYAAEGRAVRERTERLRLLRLAKEAADTKAAAGKESAAPKKKRSP
jgi:hypothetical protein